MSPHVSCGRSLYLKQTLVDAFHVSAGTRHDPRGCCKCRMMQATLQAQYEPLALMPAPQQMQRQQQQQQQQPAVYHQLALMPPQRMQPDFASMQRQALPWQQQQQVQQQLQQQLHRQPMRQQQLLQLPYTTHNNPAAQQGDEQVSACSDLASCIYFGVTWFA